jgi:hypothetical protein
VAETPRYRSAGAKIQLGSWNKADGWIIDEYLDWEDAVVLWWMPLPEPPGKEG